MNTKNIDFENIPIYVIHVHGNTERFEFIKSQKKEFGSVNIGIVDAVTPDNLKTHSIFESYHDLSDLSDKNKRNVCCSLSHRLVHEIAKNDECFIILEDDFKVVNNFQQWKNEIKLKEFDFDIIPLGGYYGWYNDSVWFENTDDDDIKIFKQVTCSVASLYTRKSSDYFIEVFDACTTIKDYAIDGFHADMVFPNVIVKSLLPLPIKTHASFSTINHAFIDHESYYDEYFKTRSH